MTERSRPPTDRGVELATPTEIASPQQRPASVGDASSRMAGAERPASVGDASSRMAGAERSEPIRVISLKAPGEVSEERLPVKQHQPRLRRLSEVAPQRQRVATPPGGFGYLAPPRDPREARTRRWRDYVLWGSVVVILAGAVMLAVWFLAGV
jgi:hypothetical protein